MSKSFHYLESSERSNVGFGCSSLHQSVTPSFEHTTVDGGRSTTISHVLNAEFMSTLIASSSSLECACYVAAACGSAVPWPEVESCSVTEASGGARAPGTMLKPTSSGYCSPYLDLDGLSVACEPDICGSTADPLGQEWCSMQYLSKRSVAELPLAPICGSSLSLKPSRPGASSSN